MMLMRLRTARLLSAAARDGVTLVMVTHDIMLKALAHRVVRMVDGKVGPGCAVRACTCGAVQRVFVS